jgi:hypothetical protein
VGSGAHWVIACHAGAEFMPCEGAQEIYCWQVWKSGAKHSLFGCSKGASVLHLAASQEPSAAQPAAATDDAALGEGATAPPELHELRFPIRVAP